MMMKNVASISNLALATAGSVLSATFSSNISDLFDSSSY